MWSRQKNQIKIFFWKEYYFWDCTHNILNFNKYFVCIIFLFVLLILQNFDEICVYKFLARPMGPLYLSSLLIKRLISTTSIAPKRAQIVHATKGNGKIIIAQSTHDIVTTLMTCSKAKLTSSLSTKQTSEFACLLKSVRMHDEHQPLITLVSLGAKSHRPHSRGTAFNTKGLWE